MVTIVLFFAFIKVLLFNVLIPLLFQAQLISLWQISNLYYFRFGWFAVESKTIF